MAGKRIIVFCLLGLVALALASFASSGSEAGTYKTYHGYSLTSTAASANSNSENMIAVVAPDYNYEDSSMFTLSPVDMWTEHSNNIPIGAGMGVLSATSTVGLTNLACSAVMYPDFHLYNASTDTTDVLSPGDMSWLLKYAPPHPQSVPLPYGKHDASLPDYLEAYPHFLNEMFDPDGAGSKPPLVPRARWVGYTDDVAQMHILVQIVMFNPGQLKELGGVYAQMGPEVGSGTVVVLNNPVSQEEAPGAISDFCSPLKTVTTNYATTIDKNPLHDPAGDWPGDQSGYTVQQNPPAGAGVLGTGTIISRNYSMSERDADGDGIENDLDPCPYTDDSGWTPRVPGGAGTGDEDADGLPDSCDPDPTGTEGNCPGTQSDCDDDGYNNRQDICPLVANGCNSGASPTCTKVNVAWDNQADDDSVLGNADKGPGPDSIGNVCDDSDDDGNEDGAGAGTCNDGIDNGGGDGIDGNDPDCVPAMDSNDSTPWGNNPGTGVFLHALPWAAECVGAADADADGYCDALETTLGSPTNNGAETVCNEEPSDCVGGPPNPCDNDADGYINDGCPIVGHYAERGAECAAGDTASDDTPTPDADEQIKANGAVRDPWVNDGCPVIGVPESLVIDATITVDTDGDTVVDNTAPQSCSDGVDNDDDGDCDYPANFCYAGSTPDAGCDPASYAGDLDHDSYADASADNCPTVWNPEQTDTDTLGSGDACDPDIDNDGFRDGSSGLNSANKGLNQQGEWWAGSDPLDNSSTPEVCDGVDNDGDGNVDEGFPDTNAGGPKDCMDDTLDADSDGTGNATDLNDDNNPNADPFSDIAENYIGTDKDVMCSPAGGPDNDPFDIYIDARADIFDIMEYIAANALGSSLAADDPEYDRRFDLFIDGKNDIFDIMEYIAAGVLGKNCPYGL